MTARTPTERPSARDYARFLGALAAGLVLTGLLYHLLRMAVWAIEGGKP